MKIQLNSINFYDDISPQEEIIDSNESSTKLIPFGKSGIHIKKKNRGSFTSYCGGKVTDACIQKGKNSPSAAIRKKATFAANARKWKHQLGGTLVSDSDKLIPISSRTDISNLFIDYDTPSNFILKLKKEEEKKDGDLNIVDNLDYYFGTNPITTFSTPTLEADDNTELETTVYQGDLTTTPEATTNPQTQGHWDYKGVDFSTVNVSDKWKNALTKHLGIQAGPFGSDWYDCSDFTERVYKELGIQIGGNCRAQYANTEHISDYHQAQLGDLIFFKGTQKKERGLKPNDPSHVAIVLDASRAPEGYITVALGTPDKVTDVREINLNKGHYRDHYLGIGRVRKPVSVKLGTKFQFGGIVPKHVSDLFVSTESPKKKYTPIDYSFLFEEEEEKPKKPLDFLTFLTQDIQLRKLIALKKKEEEPVEVIVELQPEEQPVQSQAPKSPTYSGSRYNFFKSEFDKYVLRDPSARQFEPVLTRIAKHESNFNSTVLNSSGAPAYGWFQFWQDGKTNNITHYSGSDINSFILNPLIQISSAVKLAKDILRLFTPRDYQLAQSKGYNTNALIRGAWLGGVGGVRKVLNGTDNPSDSKWYGGKGGRSVKLAMDEENQYK